MSQYPGRMDITDVAGSMTLVESSIRDLRMSEFLFEAEDTSDDEVQAAKKKIIKLVDDVKKAMAVNTGMPKTAQMFDIARKTLFLELNNKEEEALLLFALAPQAIEGVRGVLEAAIMANELRETPITGEGLNRARVYSSIPASNVLFSDKADLQKIINNGFKANPGFFKSLINSIPALNFIKDLSKGLKTTESQNLSQDLFAYLPPLFEEDTREDPLNEAGKSVIAGAAAGAGAGFAIAGPIGAAVGGLIGAAGGYFTKASAKHTANYYTALSKGGPVSGKGSVASYMPLFKNNPIHKAILEDLMNGLTLGEAIKISNAIETGFQTHIRVKPPKPRADLIAGIGDMSPEDEKVNVTDKLNSISGLTPDKRSEIIDYLKENLRATWYSSGSAGTYRAAWAKGSSLSGYLALADAVAEAGAGSLEEIADDLAKKMMPNFAMSKEKIKNTMLSADDFRKLKGVSSNDEKINALVNTYKTILDGLRLKWDDDNQNYKPVIPNRGVRKKYDEIESSAQGKFLIKHFIEPNSKVKGPRDVIREGVDEFHDILVEHWQRLAGIIK